jgi:hypothetical protein
LKCGFAATNRRTCRSQAKLRSSTLHGTGLGVTHARVRTHTRTHAHTHARAHARIHTLALTRARTYMCQTRRHTRTRTQTHARTRRHTYARARAHTHTHFACALCSQRPQGRRLLRRAGADERHRHALGLDRVQIKVQLPYREYLRTAIAALRAPPRRAALPSSVPLNFQYRQPATERRCV